MFYLMQKFSCFKVIFLGNPFVQNNFAEKLVIKYGNNKGGKSNQPAFVQSRERPVILGGKLRDDAARF